MHVRESRQCFEEIDGTIQFKHSVLLLRDGSNGLFSARISSAAQLESTVNPEDLEDLKPLPQLLICPPGVVMASEFLATAADTHAKRPNLLCLAGTNDLQASLLEEIRVCELLKHYPHPNVAKYRGCLLAGNRLEGICFKRYRETLMERVNPEHLNKSTLIQSPNRNSARVNAGRCLSGIEAGLRHLHSLGIVHNDINPTNIMFDEDQHPIIIDFDSCREIGAPLHNVKRTFSWYKKDVSVSRESNDLDALEEIKVWITGTDPDEFAFSKY